MSVSTPNGVSEDFETSLGEAMQCIWNDHCADTGAVPQCMGLHGRQISADFVGSSFVYDVVRLLKARGVLNNQKVQPPNA